MVRGREEEPLVGQVSDLDLILGRAWGGYRRFLFGAAEEQHETRDSKWGPQMISSHVFLADDQAADHTIIDKAHRDRPRYGNA